MAQTPVITQKSAFDSFADQGCGCIIPILFILILGALLHSVETRPKSNPYEGSQALMQVRIGFSSLFGSR